MILCLAWVDHQEWEVECMDTNSHHQEQYKYHLRKWKQLLVCNHLDSQRQEQPKLISHAIKMKKWPQTFYLSQVWKTKMLLYKVLLRNHKYNNNNLSQQQLLIHNQ